jgi:hypothetical protein
MLEEEDGVVCAASILIKQVCCLLHAGFFLGLFVDPEDGGDMFPRDVG